MSSADLADMLVHVVTVRTYQGTTGAGVKRYADPVTVPCFLSRKQRYIRNANGDQVISQATVSAAVDQADVLTLESLVTLSDDAETTTIIARDVTDGGSFVEGLDRVKAYLQ